MTTTSTKPWPTNKHLFWAAATLAVPAMYWLAYAMFWTQTPTYYIAGPISYELLTLSTMVTLTVCSILWALVTLVFWLVLWMFAPAVRLMVGTLIEGAASLRGPR